MLLKWGLGFKKVDIKYQDIHNLRLEQFGLTTILLFDIASENHYWALGVRRPKVDALIAFLSQEGIPSEVDDRQR